MVDQQPSVIPSSFASGSMVGLAMTAAIASAVAASWRGPIVVIVLRVCRGERTPPHPTELLLRWG